MSWEPAVAEEELWDGEMRGCRVRGQKVLLVKLGGSVHAYPDRCAHLGVPLSEGTLEEGVITCAAHHYCYDACTGHGVNPRSVSLPRYGVRIQDGTVEVDLP